jgi:transcriptional antiterminator RfaH
MVDNSGLTNRQRPQPRACGTKVNEMASDLPWADFWYLAYTKPKQEGIAHDNLVQQNFSVYLPLYKKFKKTEQGPVALFEPMFPRYIFFKPQSEAQSLSVVRSTKGINNLVRFGFEPACLDDELLGRIRRVEQMRNEASLQEINNLRVGQKVILKNSALVGLEGIVQTVSSKRVAVLLEILGRPTLVKMEHHQVESEDHIAG